MVDRELEWDLWRSFLAIVREGSLAGAARTLGVSHPTVRRHLVALEARLTAPLFTRSPSGLEPTALALDLRPVAEAMESSSYDLARRATSERDAFAGIVRITASEVIAVEVLPSLLGSLRQKHPRLSFEIHPTNQVEDILRGDADIAIRMTRPQQGDLAVRRVAQIEVGVFASMALLDRLTTPPETLGEVVASGWMIGYDRNTALLDAMKRIGIRARRADFCIRSDNDLVHLAAVRAGHGIGFVQAPLAAKDPALVRLVPDVRHRMDVWLAAHPQLARVPRIVATQTALKTGLAAFSRQGAADASGRR